MHNVSVKTLLATGAVGLRIELGFVPSYAEITNTVSGQTVKYINQEITTHPMAVANGDASIDFADGEYLGTNGIKATDSKLKRTEATSIVNSSQLAEGLILDDIVDINDTADELLLVVAYRAEV